MVDFGDDEQCNSNGCNIFCEENDEDLNNEHHLPSSSLIQPFSFELTTTINNDDDQNQEHILALRNQQKQQEEEEEQQLDHHEIDTLMKCHDHHIPSFDISHLADSCQENSDKYDKESQDQDDDSFLIVFEPVAISKNISQNIENDNNVDADSHLSIDDISVSHLFSTNHY